MIITSSGGVVQQQYHCAPGLFLFCDGCHPRAARCMHCEAYRGYLFASTTAVMMRWRKLPDSAVLNLAQAAGR